MAEIVDLRELIPDDLEFVFPAGTAGGEPVRLSIPGDLPNETVWTIFRLLLDVAQLEQSLDEKAGQPPKTQAQTSRLVRQTLAGVRGIEDRLEEILLETFRIRHPDLPALPCGKRGAAIVAETVLKHIGFLTDEPDEPDGGDGEDGDPTVGAGPTGGGSSTSRSPRSSRSSGSPRTRGGGSGSGRRGRGSSSGSGG